MSEKTTTSMVVMQKKDKLPIVCMNDIATMGQFLAQSQMFGAKNQAEGMMIVGICQQEGWSYADFMANIWDWARNCPIVAMSFMQAMGNLSFFCITTMLVVVLSLIYLFLSWGVWV